MTEQGDPLTGRWARVGQPIRTRRTKLAPDPDVRRAILAAASKSVHEQGVRGLSVAAVLEHAQLSTRAFYRHFESKDELVEAVFLEMTHAEVQRLRTRMASATSPVEAVTAWIDGRLDLAFDGSIKPELRRVAMEAPSQESVSPAYAAILEPLVEQLERGLELGVFRDVVPAIAAKSIHGVVWAGAQRRLATGQGDHAEVRVRAVRFCLRGLGVTPETIEEIAEDDDAPAHWSQRCRKAARDD